MHTVKNKPEQVKEMIFPTLLKIAVGRGRSLLLPEKKKNLLTSLRQSYQAHVNRRLCLSSVSFLDGVSVMKLHWRHLSQKNTGEILLPIIPMQNVLVENSRKIIKYVLPK